MVGIPSFVFVQTMVPQGADTNECEHNLHERTMTKAPWNGIFFTVGGIRPNGGSVAFLGIDIGSVITTAALIDDGLHMLALANTPTRIDGTFETTVADIRAAVAKALGQAGYDVSVIEGLCVSVPGIVDNESGRAFCPTLEWIEPMPVRVIARKHLSAPVYLANDAQVTAVGEAHYGTGMSFDRFALIRFGSLIEVAMVVNGVAVESETIPAQIATEGEFLLEAHELIEEDDSDDDDIDLSGVGLGRIRSSQVLEEARKHNPVALHAAEWLVDTMTQGIVSVTEGLAPEAVVISGATPRDRLYLAKRITRKLAETRSKIAGIPVEVASLGDDAKPFGAAVIAMQNA